MSIATNAFTIKYKKRVNVLITMVSVSQARVSLSSSPSRLRLQFNAIWDTGASCSCITKSAVEQLQLTSFNKTVVHTANGKRECDVYKADLFLPNGVCFDMLNLTECSDLSDKCDILIGMDIIGAGDFAIAEDNERTIMSFRVPHISSMDYVEIEKQVKQTLVQSPQIGRNDICPCGSGKKYKKCHGKVV